MGGIQVCLPYPPTANNLFDGRKGGGRRCSDKYTAWKLVAAAVINRQRPGRVAGRISVLYEIRRPDRKRRDIANCEKACSDALVAAGVIDDDCNIEELTMRWVADTDYEVRATIRPTGHGIDVQLVGRK